MPYETDIRAKTLQQSFQLVRSRRFRFSRHTVTTGVYAENARRLFEHIIFARHVAPNSLSELHNIVGRIRGRGERAHAFILRVGVGARGNVCVSSSGNARKRVRRQSGNLFRSLLFPSVRPLARV